MVLWGQVTVTEASFDPPDHGERRQAYRPKIDDVRIGVNAEETQAG
jgi:hypothetical protein